MNIEKITLEDCLDLYEKKGIVTILKDGKVIGFQKETEE